MKCTVTVYTVYSCRPLSHLSVVFIKISSCKGFPLVWEYLCAANAQKIHVSDWETWAQDPAFRASRASFCCKPAWDMACLTMQREQEVPCAGGSYVDSSTTERQALKWWCLCLAQVDGTEGGLIALPLLQGTTKKLWLMQCSSSQNAFWAKLQYHVLQQGGVAEHRNIRVAIQSNCL